MSDLLLFAHGLMKIGLVIGVMVLVATWPRRSSAAESVVQHCTLLFAGVVDTLAANPYVHSAESASACNFDDKTFAETGSLMKRFSLLDTDELATDSTWPNPVSQSVEDSLMDSDSDRFEPLFNIDGTMMMGDFDTNGNMHGTTDSHSDSWDSSGSSMWDD
jgi:hypothetical protein